MNHTNSSIRVSIGVGGLGVMIHLLAAFLLFVLPSSLLGPATRGPYLETVFAPVATASTLVLVYGMLPIAWLAGYYLTNRVTEPLDRVVAGLLVGGFVFGAGVAAVDWLVTNPQYATDLLAYAGQALRFAARLVGAGSFGALCGLALARER